MRRQLLIPVTVILCFLTLLLPSTTSISEFPVYRVVIDPGHGGQSLFPRYLHGDRFDTMSGGYRDLFRDGAYGPGVSEHQIMYSIAVRVMNILEHCSGRGAYGTFHDIIKGYSSRSPRIIIEAFLSRPRSFRPGATDADPNAPYRLYDYPDNDGVMQPGRISRINSHRPHMVVSLHCAASGPRDYKGMSSVIVPPYSYLHRGLLYLQGYIERNEVFRGKYAEYWFSESVKRTPFSWYLSDVSLYFLSQPLDNDRYPLYQRSRGYRHNMVQWSYRDRLGWENAAGYAIANTHFTRDIIEFNPSGPFWEREQSLYESYRRHGGPEGYGGDNAYAGNEIIRHIIRAMEKNGHRPSHRRPAKPYVSVWAMPLLVNAINAYIELGYLRRKEDRNMMLYRQDEIAEGIAMGIHSLLAGSEPRVQSADGPRGKRIDLSRYAISNEISYFDEVRR